MITRVWIKDETCAQHNLCVVICPEVFEMTSRTARVKPDAIHYLQTKEIEIRDAFRCCPVDAICIEQSELKEGNRVASIL